LTSFSRSNGPFTGPGAMNCPGKEVEQKVGHPAKGNPDQKETNKNQMETENNFIRKPQMVIHDVTGDKRQKNQGPVDPDRQFSQKS